ncbi:MAG: hypothetical protein AB1899_10250 [Pseudomonadota bacterium]
MLAFEVEIDGERHIVAGEEDWSILALHVNGMRGDPTAKVESARVDRHEFSVGGLSEPDANGVSYHFRWPGKELRLGSRVVVTLIDTDSPDSPIKRFRSDHEIQESPFTDDELRELRKQDYLELKKEFDN